jgi:hypothetical protein
MKNYCALLNNNVVVEIIVADLDWVQNNLQGQWVEIGVEPLTVAIGWTYDEATQDFIAPEPVEP